MAEQSIKSLFAVAEEKRHSYPSSDDPQQNLAAAITNYVNCLQLVDRLSLFSPNETLEDLNSGDIQYLTINYHLAVLIQQIPDLPNKRFLLEKSRDKYEQFLSILDQYELFSDADKKSYNRYLESPTTFIAVPHNNPAAQRDARISGFRYKMGLQKKLEFLSQNPAYLQKDDDAVRQVHLANIALCTHETFQELDLINRQVVLLAEGPPAPHLGPAQAEQDPRERKRDEQKYSVRIDMTASEFRNNPKSANDALQKYGFLTINSDTIHSARLELQHKVHSGPPPRAETHKERFERLEATGGKIEGGGKASEIVPEKDEDDYEKGDEETYKARQWDEYKEENPKGSGNTLNRG